MRGPLAALRGPLPAASPTIPLVARLVGDEPAWDAPLRLLGGTALPRARRRATTTSTRTILAIDRPALTEPSTAARFVQHAARADERGAALVGAAAGFLAARRAAVGVTCRRRRARAERRASTSLWDRYRYRSTRERTWGPAGCGARAGGRAHGGSRRRCSTPRSHVARAIGIDRLAGRRHDRRGRAAARVLRLGRPGRSGSSACARDRRRAREPAGARARRLPASCCRSRSQPAIRTRYDRLPDSASSAYLRSAEYARLQELMAGARGARAARVGRRSKHRASAGSAGTRTARSASVPCSTCNSGRTASASSLARVELHGHVWLD